MIPVSDLMRTAMGFSRTVRCVVDFYQNGVLVLPDAPVASGTISWDRGAKVRGGCRLSLAVPEWTDLPIDNKAGRFKVRRGVSSLGYVETIQLGEFRIDDITRPAVGTVDITGSGIEAYVDDARFLTPRTPPYGSSTVGSIIDLVREALPSAVFVLRNTQDKRVQATATWDKERLDAVGALAASIGAEVFVDHSGSWIIADIPSPLTGSPVYIVDEGDGGVLIDRKEVDTRDRVYNAASVSGQSSDQNVPPAWAWSYDANPASPTYYYGPFGQKPIFFTSQFFTNNGQCQAYADTLLAEALAANVSLSFSTAPIDFLEVGDLVAIRDRHGSLEPLLIQTASASLGPDGGLDCTTLSSKAVIADGA